MTRSDYRNRNVAMGRIEKHAQPYHLGQYAKRIMTPRSFVMLAKIHEETANHPTRRKLAILDAIGGSRKQVNGIARSQTNGVVRELNEHGVGSFESPVAYASREQAETVASVETIDRETSYAMPAL